jgi:hypothetical protein
VAQLLNLSAADAMRTIADHNELPRREGYSFGAKITSRGPESLIPEDSGLDA